MILDLVYIVVGLIFLVLSADKFITGASNTALYLGMSPLLVGLLIVGFGTSAPEMIVSAIAAFNNSPGIALGNAYGSNIVNIGFVLGLTTMIYPIYVNSKIIRKEIPILIATLAVSYGFFSNLFLTRTESIVLLLLILGLTFYSVFYQESNDSFEIEAKSEYSDYKKLSLKKSLTYLIGGLIVLLISSDFLVTGAVNVAKFFKVNDLVIGLTIIAIGTSLPELAATIVAARKKEYDMVLGNIIGSGLFNVLAVVGIAGAIKPMSIDQAFINRDFVTVVILVIMLWIFAFGFRGTARINRIEGSVLLLTYFGYNIYLVSTII